MKTEQEQIKAMAEKMKRCLEKNGLLNFKWFAEALVQAGYGDISEYKAEIEQLKAKNKVLGDGVVKAFTNGFNTGREQVEKDTRRAKINILNKLKENAIEIGIDTSEFDNIEFVEVDAIDELIKEVENEKV